MTVGKKKEQEQKKKKPEKPRESPMEFLASMAVVLVVGLFIITFNLQAFEIPSSSMEETLLIGDHVFVDRVSFAPRTGWAAPLLPYRQVKRGDIAVFLSPSEPGLYVVKRVVGLPGDRLRLQDGVLHVNGEPLEEPYVVRTGGYDAYRDEFPAVPAGFNRSVTAEWRAALPGFSGDGDLVVPAQRYFAMGDNRDLSLDSRYWGFVPQENLIGRPLFIYWSFETPPQQYTRRGLRERVAFLFHIVVRFVDRTRWDRMFMLVR
jgi:signal peptidase I